MDLFSSLLVDANDDAVSDGFKIAEITDHFVMKSTDLYLENILNITHIGTWELLLHQSQMRWSPELYRIFGVSPDDFLPSYENYLLKIHPDDRGCVKKLIEAAIEEHKSFSFDGRILWPNGSIHHLHTWGYAIVNELGRLVGIVGVCQDITETKIKEEDLERSHLLSKAVTEGMSDAVFIKDLSGRYLFVNSAWARLLEKPKENILSKRDSVILPDRMADFFVKVNRTRYNPDDIQVIEQNLTMSNGVTLLLQMTIGPYKAHSGRIVGFIGIVRDVTEIKEHKRELEKILSLQSATLEATADGILVVNQNGKIVSFNKRFLDMWEIAAPMVQNRYYKDVLGSILNRLVNPEECVRRLEDIFSNSHTDSRDIIKFKNGIFLERYSRPQRVDNQIIGRVFSYRNVTERMLAEKLLREREERKSAILNSSLDSIISVDFEGKVRDFNRAAEVLFGYQSSQIIGKEIWEVIIPYKLRSRFKEGFDRFVSTGIGPVLGKKVEITALKAGGVEIPIEILITEVRSNGYPLFTGFIREISERKAYQNELEKTVTLHRSILDSLLDGVVAVDRAGKITFMNKVYADLWRLPADLNILEDQAKAFELAKARLKNPEDFLLKVQRAQEHPEVESFDLIEFLDGRIFERVSRPQIVAERCVGRVVSVRDVSNQVSKVNRSVA